MGFVHGCPASLLCPWDFPGKNTRVGCHFLLQGIFLTQGSNLGLLLCRQILYHLSHQGRLPSTIHMTYVQCGTMELQSSLFSSWWGRARIQEGCSPEIGSSCILNDQKVFTKQIKEGIYNFKNQQGEKKNRMI